jgi:hypothetical protein
MVLWGIITPDLGIERIDYPIAMLKTSTLWLAIAPLVAAAGRRRRK